MGTSALRVRLERVMGDGAYQRMVGEYSNAMKGQLGEVLVLQNIFPKVFLMGSGHAKCRTDLIC